MNLTLLPLCSRKRRLSTWGGTVFALLVAVLSPAWAQESGGRIARGLQFFVEPPKTYVEVVEFTVVPKMGAGWTEVFSVSGNTVKVPPGGRLETVLYPTSADDAASVAVNPALSAEQKVAEVERMHGYAESQASVVRALANKYPKYKAKLDAASRRWKKVADEAFAQRGLLNAVEKKTVPGVSSVAMPKATIRTKAGKVYQGVEVSRVEGERVYFNYSGGVTFVEIKDLDAELQKKYRAAAAAPPPPAPSAMAVATINGAAEAPPAGLNPMAAPKPTQAEMDQLAAKTREEENRRRLESLGLTQAMMAMERENYSGEGLSGAHVDTLILGCAQLAREMNWLGKGVSMSGGSARAKAVGELNAIQREFLRSRHVLAKAAVAARFSSVGAQSAGEVVVGSSNLGKLFEELRTASSAGNFHRELEILGQLAGAGIVGEEGGKRRVAVDMNKVLEAYPELFGVKSRFSALEEMLTEFLKGNSVEAISSALSLAGNGVGGG